MKKPQSPGIWALGLHKDARSRGLFITLQVRTWEDKAGGILILRNDPMIHVKEVIEGTLSLQITLVDGYSF